MKRMFLVPDTNVFLHFPPLSDVDWCSIAGCEAVTIVIAPTVTRELNDHKDNPRSRKLRDRADAALKDFHARFKGAKPKELRPGVDIEFLTAEPSVDFLAYGLVKDLPDDWLIATGIDLAAKRVPDDVAVVTADFGLDVKAAPHVKVVEMPEAMRLPEEQNAEEKKIKDLERQLKTIQAAAPDLKVTFPDGGIFTKLLFFDLKTRDHQEIASILAKAEKEHPRAKEEPAQPTRLNIDFSKLNKEWTEKHNQRVDAYLKDLKKYLYDLNGVLLWFNKTAEVKLLVQNSGGAPADDIDVYLHFPDGFEVIGEEDLPKKPAKPSPPPSQKDAIKAMFEMPQIDFSALARPYNFGLPKAVENVQLLNIKKTKSHEVEFYIRRLKHQNVETLPPLFLHFPNEPQSFRADYRIVAANVPSAITGTLDFVVK
jgi:hypothetical protein